MPSAPTLSDHTVKTSRGLTYHYLYSPAQDGKLTLLFLHGFPSGPHDWPSQITFFANDGYGVLMPDLLGYGGTDKPTDTNLYAMGEMVEDVIDILDDAKLSKVVSVGHDW